MSAGTPDYLGALGLGRDADERSIRRAYAQRLKQIDAAKDADGFQALRAAYEAALRWADFRRRQEGSAGAAETAAPPEAVDSRAQHQEVCTAETVPPNDPILLGQEVFAQFASICTKGFQDEASARQALANALNDPCLLNLEARLQFEWRVIRLLLNGWRPGHEFLFSPACDCFTWEQDRRRLSMFGSAGAALDAAIDEKLIFFRQAPTHFEVQRKLIRSLRDDGMPSKRSLVEEMPYLQVLMQRYPHWLRMITSHDNFMRRQQELDRIPASERQAERTVVPSPASSKPKLPSFKGSFAGWLAVIAFGALVVLIGTLGNAPTYRYGSPGATPVPPAPNKSMALPRPATGEVSTVTRSGS